MPATITADATATIGTYTLTLSPGAGTTFVSNPSTAGTGGNEALKDATSTLVTIDVVAPTRKNTTLSLGNATGTYGGSVDLSARLMSGTSGVNDKIIVFSRKNSSGGYDALCDTDSATDLRA